MLYRFYLLDQDNHIKAAETFCAADDATAQETADLVYDACDDEFQRYELWRNGERVTTGWVGANVARGSRLSDVVSTREENILDLEDRLQRTFTCVRRSRKLLEITSALRNRINGV